MSEKFPKPKRVVDLVFLDRVRRLRCLVVGCSQFYTDPHHLISRGAGGSDYTAIPLCRKHHTELHAIGKARFESDYGVDLWEVSSRVVSKYAADLIERVEKLGTEVDEATAVIRRLEESAYNERED